MAARLIKFRIWDKQYHLMYVQSWGSLRWDKNKGTDLVFELVRENDLKSRDCSDNELECEMMQFTGSVDKNGKELFDGDIISGFNGGVIGQIAWNKDACAWWLFGGTPEKYTHGEYLSQDYLDNFEIIGNIYQNPDLF